MYVKEVLFTILIVRRRKSFVKWSSSSNYWSANIAEESNKTDESLDYSNPLNTIVEQKVISDSSFQSGRSNFKVHENIHSKKILALSIPNELKSRTNTKTISKQYDSNQSVFQVSRLENESEIEENPINSIDISLSTREKDLLKQYEHRLYALLFRWDYLINIDSISNQT